MKDRVLIDTSVWIAYFKNKDNLLSERVDEVLTSADIYVPRVVIAELIQGAKSEKEILIIEDFIDAFNIIDQTSDTWLKAGRLSFSMKKKGLTVHVLDCYIAVLAMEHDCKIFSLDEHFKNIKRFLKVELI
ncbi:MAG: PIN domain-containing protein [Nitrospirae bacterium]|nr:PIN domain-containing protein [Nitrospirota bacterium]